MRQLAVRARGCRRPPGPARSRPRGSSRPPATSGPRRRPRRSSAPSARGCGPRTSTAARSSRPKAWTARTLRSRSCGGGRRPDRTAARASCWARAHPASLPHREPGQDRDARSARPAPARGPGAVSTTSTATRSSDVGQQRGGDRHDGVEHAADVRGQPRDQLAAAHPVVEPQRPGHRAGEHRRAQVGTDPLGGAFGGAVGGQVEQPEDDGQQAAWRARRGRAAGSGRPTTGTTASESEPVGSRA